MASGRPNMHPISLFCKFPADLVRVITDAAQLRRIFSGDNMPPHEIPPSEPTLPKKFDAYLANNLSLGCHCFCSVDINQTFGSLNDGTSTFRLHLRRKIG